MEFEYFPAWRVVVLGLSGEMCRVDLEYPCTTIHHLKKRISVSLLVPIIGFDLFAADGIERMKPRDWLEDLMPFGRGAATVSLVKVPNRICDNCGAQISAFNKKAEFEVCQLCFDVFYCDIYCVFNYSRELGTCCRECMQSFPMFHSN